MIAQPRARPAAYHARMQAGAPLALVFGGSGQIGRALLPRLLDAGWRVRAVSRQPSAALPRLPGLTWQAGDLAHLPALPVEAQAIVSAGPLDLFAQWLPRVPAGVRVVAFGSTSVHAKRASPDPHERALAARLQAAEHRLAARAADEGRAITLLRPTLIYGRGGDRSLSAIAALARRFGHVVLPTAAQGLRQPVHADDLADAALAALARALPGWHAFDLPGGEALPYREMVQRVLATLQPPPRLHALPLPLFLAALRAAQALGIARALGPAAVRRMREDLVFDPQPARAALGYAPRPFAPQPGQFG